MQSVKTESPCLSCTRVRNPGNCENKQCKVWQKWFCEQWELTRRTARARMEAADPAPLGVSIGGRRYAQPHQVQDYLERDPCTVCLCPRELCTSPCRLRRQWEEVKAEVSK